MLHRFDPFAELQRIQDDLFTGTRPSRAREAKTFAPAVDIWEDEGAIYLRAELPGVRSEDVDVTVENDLLTLKGERKLDRPEQASYHRVETVYGNFTRSFALPKTVDASAIEANLEAGLLTLRVPKRAEVQPRKIAVKVGGGKKDVIAKA
jgi:HSP20 family protein